MMGRWTTLAEIEAGLSLKVGKMISQVGPAGLKKLGKTRMVFRQEIFQTLKTGKEYLLPPAQTLSPKAAV